MCRRCLSESEFDLGFCSKLRLSGCLSEMSKCCERDACLVRLGFRW